MARVPQGYQEIKPSTPFALPLFTVWHTAMFATMRQDQRARVVHQFTFSLRLSARMDIFKDGSQHLA